MTTLESIIIKAEKDHPTDDWILQQFLSYLSEKRLSLYPAQEEALLEIFEGKNVILNTPTGSGKSLVALALHFYAVMKKRKSCYTSPIKALVNEKFFDLCRTFGAHNVGMVTGDGTVNGDAPIICCTAEVLSNRALREGSALDILDIVMDEFHYYSDRERGVAWQVPLLSLPQSRFLLMSATMGNSEPFAKYLTALNQIETQIVQSRERPVPLEFSYSEIPLHEQVQKLIEKGRVPIYLVSFTQKECADSAQNFMSIDLCSKSEKQLIDEEIKQFKFSSPYGKDIKKFLKHGIGIHHAGLLPKYRVLVEKLAQKGLLKMIAGTDTLGVGVNVPIRTVLFSKLCKFDGKKATLLTVRDFHQIAGRAGRKGFDDLGTVVAQAPEHIIENQRNEAKALNDPKKLKKLVKKKPPEWGYVPWNQDTFEKLIRSESEPLTSRFNVNHAMLLNVLSRPNEDACKSMRHLICMCHESDGSKKNLRRRAFSLFRSLVEREIIRLNPLRINVELQEDFSLNHALSLFLIDTLQWLDPMSDLYPLEVLTLTESILESPDLILRKQLDRVKREKLLELKSQGVEFDERMEELEKLEHPKPMRDFIYNHFNSFASKHPWLGEENIRPKSIAREIYEGFYSFSDYIKEYDLQRAEGLLLRYLSDVYKALTQNIPETSKSEGVLEISIYLSTMIRQIDSSLIDEWEQLTGTGSSPSSRQMTENTPNPSLQAQTGQRDEKRFLIELKNETFRFLKCLQRRQLEEALSILETPGEWTEGRLLQRLDQFEAENSSSVTADARSRNREALIITPLDGRFYSIEQTLFDSEESTDWILRLKADKELSFNERRPILYLEEFARSGFSAGFNTP